MFRSIPVLVLAVTTATAQDFWFPMGFAGTAGPPTHNAPVARVKDANLDGRITVPDELTAGMLSGFPDGNGLMFLRDGDAVIENGEVAFYWADTETGDVIRGQDLNHDGFLDASEITEFFTFGRRTNNNVTGSPDAVAAFRNPASGQTIVYATLQAYTTSTLPAEPGIYRLVDLNGDGDAMDPGEATLFVGSSLNLTVPGNSGPVPLNLHFWDRLKVLPGGKLIAWADGATLLPTGTPPSYTIQPMMNAFYGFTDNNGTAVPEVWLNVSTLNDLPLHPDFANNTFPNLDIQRAAGERDNFVRFFDVAPPIAPGAPATYYIGSSYNSGFETNLNGQIVSGLFFRVIDANNNQVIDNGELTLYANLSGVTYAGVAPITVADIGSGGTITTLGTNDRPWGMDVSPDGGLHFLVNTNGGSVISMRDGNFSGVIEQGEAVMTFTLFGFGAGNWPYPFDNSTTPPSSAATGPFWDGIVALSDGMMPGPFPAGVSVIGDGCIGPTRGLKPVMDVFNGAPQIGNLNLQIAAIRAAPATPVVMVAAFSAAPVPVPLSVVGLPLGCNLYLNSPQTVGFTFSDPSGRAPVTLGLPNNPQFIGAQILFQAAVFDPAVAAATKFITTNAVRLTVQP